MTEAPTLFLMEMVSELVRVQWRVRLKEDWNRFDLDAAMELTRGSTKLISLASSKAKRMETLISRLRALLNLPLTGYLNVPKKEALLLPS